MCFNSFSSKDAYDLALSERFVGGLPDDELDELAVKIDQYLATLNDTEKSSKKSPLPERLIERIYLQAAKK